MADTFLGGALGLSGEPRDLGNETANARPRLRRRLDLRADTQLSAPSSRATTGSDTTQISKSGSSARPTPSTTTMVFCSSSSSGRVCMSNSSVYLEELAEQLRHRDFARRLAMDRLADGAERLGEVVDRMLRGT